MTELTGAPWERGDGVLLDYTDGHSRILVTLEVTPPGRPRRVAFETYEDGVQVSRMSLPLEEAAVFSYRVFDMEGKWPQ